MANATCPKCKARFPIISGEQPVCPGCGAKFKAPKPQLPEDILPPMAKTIAPPPLPAHHATAAVVLETAAPPLVATASPLPELPAASPASEVLPFEASAVVTPTWRPTFEPRTYPAMRVIITVLYAFAILTGISFVVNFGFGVLVILGGVSVADDSGLAAGMGLLSGIAFMAITLFTHGLFVLLFMASAESIRVGLDIQHNTQEAAFYSKLSRQWAD